jgi:glutathione S-transferase
MGKVPAIRHRGKVVTEVAAICCYLADAFPDRRLAPPPAERADYYRWIFFTSGPVEAAFSNKAAGWEPTPERQRMFGYGCYDLAINTLEKALAGKEYIAADHFTAADLFVGANVNFMLAFNLLEPREVFVDYARRMTDRPAYRRAKEIDAKLIAEAQPAQQQPA